MKKNIIGLIGVLFIVSLTACGNKPEASALVGQAGQETTEGKLENEVVTEDVSEQQEKINLPAGEIETDLILEKLVGEYEYVSDYGNGSLTII